MILNWFNWLNILPQRSKSGRLARRARVGKSNGPRLARSTNLVLEHLEERLALANDLTIATGGAINTAAALIQAQNAGDFSFGNTGTFTIDPGAFTGAGAIALQANNDVTITRAINDNNAGDSLTIQAGRSIIDNANITYATALNLTANSHLAAVGAGTAGTAAFTMGAGATILSGASINITLDSGIGLNAAGNVSVATLNAPAVTIADKGPTAGSSIVDPSGGDIVSQTITLSAINGSVGQNTQSLNLTTATVTAQAASGIFLSGGGSLALGNITNNSGEVDVAAVGSIRVNGSITDNDPSANGAVILNSAASGTAPANITFGASGVVAGYNETFIAGDGDTATSVVDFTNATLQGPTGAGSSPTFFTDQQDASIANAPVLPAQFGNGVPLHYALTSQQGSVTLATAADVANSNLVLTSNAGAGAGGIDLGEGTAATFTLASLSANASAGNSIQLDSIAAAPQITTSGTVGSTTNGMIFSGALLLSHDTTLDANHGGGVDFASPIGNNLGNGNSLTVTAGGAVTVGGGFESLRDFTITAAAINLNGPVLADGTETYNGPVLLDAGIVLVDVATTFSGTIDSTPGSSQYDLNIVATAGAMFEGNIGTNNALNSLTVGAGVPSTFTGATIVDTIGDQSYTGAVTVGSDLALISSSGAVGFGSTVDSSAGKTFSLTVAATTGTATFGGAVGGTDHLSQLVVTATTIALDGGSVQTKGDQVYNGAVSLGAATHLNTAQYGVVNFNGTLDGANALTIGNVNTAGEAIFGGDVGSATALTSLAVTATRILINGSSVTTSGTAGQTYSGDAFLGGTSPIALSASAAGNRVTFNGDLTLGASYATATDTLNVTGTLAFNNNSGRSTLYSTLNSQGSGGGALAFGQIDASSADLTGVNLSLTFAAAPTIGSNSYTIVQGSGSTSFLNVTADNATKFYVSGVDFTADDSSNNLVLTPTSPTHALTVGSGSGDTYSTIQAAIDASVSGDVIEIDGTASPYAGFTTNNGTSNVSLLFDAVGGVNVAINSAVMLTADTAFELSGTGLTFSGSSATIDGDVNLTFGASTGENLSLQAAVGGSTPLNSLTTGASVTTQLATNITTNTASGGQTYYGNLQLQTSLTGHLATLTAKTATFNGSVGDGISGGGEDSLSVTGNAVFSGISRFLGGLTVSGATFMNNGGITTTTTHGASGAQTYSGALILGSASTTLSAPGTLSLAATNGLVGNGQSLTITATGPALTLNGSQIDDVGALSVTDDTGLTLGGDLVTSGTQSFSSATGIGLNSNTTLTAVNAAGAFQTVTLGNAVNTPAQSLSINGNVNFNDNVTVSSLNVGGTTTFQTSAAAVNTTTGQTYSEAVSNTGTNALDLTDSGPGVVFGSTLANNSEDLTITGNAAFDGTVTNVANLHITRTATFANGATSVDAAGGTGNLTIDGGMTLANITGTLTLHSAGLTTLNAVAGGGNGLTIDGDNGVAFDGAVSNVDNLSANVVNNVPFIIDTAAITTNGTQTYSNAVQLGASANLTGSTVNLNGGALDGNTAGTDSLTITGDATIGGSIGGNAPGSLTVIGATTVDPATPGTPVTFDTVGNQTYEGAFTIGVNVSTLSLTTAPTITFDGPIIGNGIELDIQNGAVFQGVVNDVGVLNVFGTTAIDGGIVNSTDTQTYSGAVNLGQPAGSLFTNTVLTATGAASSIVLGGVVGVGGASTSLSVFADDRVDLGGAVGLAASGGTLNAVADSTGLNAAGSGNGQIFVSGAVNTFGGSVLLAGSAFNDTAPIDAGSGTIDLAPSVTATVGVGAASANFQVTNAQLTGLTAGLLIIGGVDATSVTVSGANATTSGVTGLVSLVSGPLNTSGPPVGAILFTSSGSQFDATANMGLVCATNGAITVSANVSASGPVTLTAGTNVTISTGATVESGAGSVTFNVGAANSGSSSSIEGTVSGTSVLVKGGSGNDALTVDYTHGTSLPDGLTFNGGGGTNTLTVTDAGGRAGHTYTISGSGVARDGAPLIGLASVQSVLVTGGNGNDVFNVTPAATTTFTLNGGSNVAGGDQLNYLASNLPIRVVPGKFTANFLQDVIFTNFEKLNLENAAGVNTIAGPDTADRSTALTGLTADEAFIQTLYLDNLGRAGGKAELDGWLAAFNSGGSTAVASDIQASQEARNHLVKSWYLTYLGRAANGVEEQIWVNLLATESEEQVLSAILSNSGHEFYNRAQTLISSGTADERYVKALYFVLLDRSPSAAEVQGWINVLPQIGLQGIALEFLHATEFRTDLFESYYNALLDRPSDAPGLNSLVTSTADTAQVRVDFGGSPEFFNDG